MHEHGNPFPGRLPLFGRPAAQFVAPVQLVEQFGVAPIGDPFAASAAEIHKPVSQFHAGRMRQGVGQYGDRLEKEVNRLQSQSRDAKAAELRRKWQSKVRPQWGLGLVFASQGDSPPPLQQPIPIQIGTAPVPTTCRAGAACRFTPTGVGAVGSSEQPREEKHPRNWILPRCRESDH